MGFQFLSLFSFSSWREAHARSTLSFLISSIVHTALFIFLACTYAAVRPESKAIVLQTVIADSDSSAVEFAQLQSPEPVFEELPQSRLSQPNATASKELDLSIDVQLEQSISRPADGLGSTADKLSAQLASARGSVGNFSSEEVGEQLGKGGANFFGSYAKVKSSYLFSTVRKA